MVLIGLLFVLVAIAAAVLLVMGALPIDTTSSLEPGIFKFELTPLALLIAGAAVMLLLWLGLGMIRGSVKRRRRPAREAKETQRRAELEESIRADERARAEETHQGALAERDRLHGEELETRLAERDRQREDEFRTREREIEDRVRAEERTKLEREFAGRQATGAGAPVAGAAAGAGVGAGAGYAAHEHSTRVDDGSADERRYTGDDATAGDLRQDGPDRNAEGDRLAENGAVAEEDRPAHRTMADRLMGRDPERRD